MSCWMPGFGFEHLAAYGVMQIRLRSESGKGLGFKI